MKLDLTLGSHLPPYSECILFLPAHISGSFLWYQLLFYPMKSCPFIFKILIIFITYICIYLYSGEGTWHGMRLEGNLEESLLSFHHMGPGTELR